MRRDKPLISGGAKHQYNLRVEMEHTGDNKWWFFFFFFLPIRKGNLSCWPLILRRQFWGRAETWPLWNDEQWRRSDRLDSCRLKGLVRKLWITVCLCLHREISVLKLVFKELQLLDWTVWEPMFYIYLLNCVLTLPQLFISLKLFLLYFFFFPDHRHSHLEAGGR